MSISTSKKFRSALEARAADLGFVSVGIASARAAPELKTHLEAFLADGHHGTMDWIARDPDRRASPDAMWEGARSAIVLGTSYAPDSDPMDLLKEAGNGAISAYARRRDYHDVIKGRLKQLAGWVAAQTGEDVKVFVDTAPLMEKPLAAAAGIGWQGKHTNLVSRAHGSWLLLGVILSAAELDCDAAEIDHCGSCTACLEICPTDAFPAPYRLDARKCIAYLTIEHDGPIDPQYREAIGNRVFGCDDCLAVCPWNKFAAQSHDAKLAMKPELEAMPLADYAELDDATFRQLFAGTPVKRTGHERFLRNVMIAIGNSGEAQLIPTARNVLQSGPPLAQAMAVWALSRLMGKSDLKELYALHGGGSEAHIEAEWERALTASEAGSIGEDI